LEGGRKGQTSEERDGRKKAVSGELGEEDKFSRVGLVEVVFGVQHRVRRQGASLGSRRGLKVRK
jgi:hypothetical protein